MTIGYNKVTREWASDAISTFQPASDWILDPVFDDPTRANELGPDYWTYPGGSTIHVMTDAEIDVDPTFLANAQTAQRSAVNDYRSAILYSGYTQTFTPAVTGVTSGAGGSFVVAGDQTPVFIAGMTFTVAGSTGNDGTYTVVSCTYDGSTASTIVVSGTIPDTTADGTITITNKWNSAPVDIQNLSAVVTLITAGAITGNVTWHDYDNFDHEMPPTSMIALGAGLAVFGQTCYAVSWTHKANINALTTVTDVNNYDYTTGWPA